MDKAVVAYINAIDDTERKKDILALVELIEDISGKSPAMYGSSIVSFGMYHYAYESGREGDAPIVGLSNRKQAITLYGLHLADTSHPNETLLAKLGKHKTGKGCLYISSLQDIDMAVLKKMIQNVY